MWTSYSESRPKAIIYTSHWHWELAPVSAVSVAMVSQSISFVPEVGQGNWLLTFIWYLWNHIWSLGASFGPPGEWSARWSEPSSVLVQEAEGAGARGVRGDAETEFAHPGADTASGEAGRMGSYSCAQQPNVDRDRCSSGIYNERTKSYMDRTGTRICRKGTSN